MIITMTAGGLDTLAAFVRVCTLERELEWGEEGEFGGGGGGGGKVDIDLRKLKGQFEQGDGGLGF